MNPDLARALALFGIAVRAFMATLFRLIEVLAGILASTPLLTSGHVPRGAWWCRGGALSQLQPRKESACT